ncbi:ankyrin repeat domain-containing protein [Candidatus Dependentiae bacterium]|nr:ankyrin repeat domain-containing protein [Candidatus Dependentiae bacterium]
MKQIFRVVIIAMVLAFSVDSGAMSNDKESVSSEFIFEACKNGNQEQVRAYVEKGGSLCIINENGWTPLLCATIYGHLSLVKMLIKSGADAFYLDHNKDTALQYAAYHGHVPLVKYFIDLGLPLDNQDAHNFQTALLDAILNGNQSCAQELILRGAHVALADKQGTTPLMGAVKQGMLTIVKLLITHKAPINAYDSLGATALSYAYENNADEIIALLESHGAHAPLTTPAAMRYKLKTVSMADTTKALILQKIAQLEQAHGNPYEVESLRQMLQHIFKLPWGNFTSMTNDFATARAMLNADHAYMDKVKDEILDYIALYVLKPEQVPPILCLVGPAGVGKTSLAISIAKALNRSFERVAVGGVSEASALRGHQRVYIGAEPGLFTKALIRAGSMNPVILVDEIDKMGHSTMHGDPYAALLELFDPQQNDAFRDENLEIPLDFSKTIFIATANSIDNLSYPLRDRMKIVRLSSYSTAEKLTIIEKHLLKKIASECGIQPKELQLSKRLLTSIINAYTHEAGVRAVGRLLKTLCAKVARAKLEAAPIVINQETLATLLGPARPESNVHDHQPTVGVVTGLSWSELGGDTLAIEALIMPGSGKLKLTGNLGDVMKESAQAALSYVRAHADTLGISQDLVRQSDIHIHVPEGATPKDGPSAGAAIATSIISAFTKRPVNGMVAMTGEINLRGSVEPIGGLKEKIVAAKRDGFTHVCAPYGNRHDLMREQDVLNDIQVTWVKTLDEVLSIALLPAVCNT